MESVAMGKDLAGNYVFLLWRGLNRTLEVRGSIPLGSTGKGKRFAEMRAESLGGRYSRSGRETIGLPHLAALRVLFMGLTVEKDKPRQFDQMASLPAPRSTRRLMRVHKPSTRRTADEAELALNRDTERVVVATN